MSTTTANSLELDLKSERPEYQAFSRFAALYAKRKAIKKDLEQVEKEIHAAEPQLRDFLGATGFQRVRVAGHTIYLRRELWARAREGCSQPLVCAALKRNGLAHFVGERWEVGRLSAHLRDLEEAFRAELDSGAMQTIVEALPEEVARVLSAEPYYNVLATTR